MSAHVVLTGGTIVEELEVDMEMETGPDCRVCLQTVTPDEAFPIASELTMDEDEVVVLSDILSIICGVTVNEADGLPENVCTFCRDGLIAAYQLRQLAQKSEAYMNKERGIEGQNQQAKQGLFVVAEEEEDDGAVALEDNHLASLAESGAQVTLKQEAPDSDMPYKCPVCLKRFHVESTMKLHMQMHNTVKDVVKTEKIEELYRCGECGEDFTTMAEMDKHWRTHSNPVESVIEYDSSTSQGPKRRNRRYQCPHCERSFVNLSNMSPHHKKEHKGFVSFACERDDCDMVFPTEDFLKDHIEIVHFKRRTYKYHCTRPGCDRVFRQLSNLKEHEYVHENARRHVCEVCNKGFNSINGLRAHAVRHTGEKKFECDRCTMKFVDKPSLKHHYRTHTGEKPYKCPDCDMAFATHFSWTKHKRTHTGERPYVCEVCSMRFNSSYHMNRHLRTHTGEKPYKCEYCDKSFSQTNDLIKHKRSHVGKNIYQCTDCPETFSMFRDLKAHSDTHFKDGSQDGEDEDEELEEEDGGPETVEEEVIHEEVDFA